MIRHTSTEEKEKSREIAFLSLFARDPSRLRKYTKRFDVCHLAQSKLLSKPFLTRR